MNKDTYAVITGTGYYAPEKVLTNADLEKIVDTSDEWITTRTGIRERHIAAENEYTSDMALVAVRQAMAGAKITGEDVDAIYVATATPDNIFPATACYIQAAIGADHAYGFDLSAACSGFLMALDVATAAIESGKIKTALVVGAEKLSIVTDWTDRSTCVLFGDGAGAVVVQAANKPGVRSLLLRVDGNKANILKIPAGGCRIPASLESIKNKEHCVRMSGGETFKSAVTAMYRIALDAVAKAGLSLDDITCIIPHQANLRIVEAVAQRLGNHVMDKVYLNLDRYGNTSAASIPLALGELNEAGRLKTGDLILMVAFGGGLSWGAAIVEWQATAP